MFLSEFDFKSQIFKNHVYPGDKGPKLSLPQTYDSTGGGGTYIQRELPMSGPLIAISSSLSPIQHASL